MEENLFPSKSLFRDTGVTQIQQRQSDGGGEACRLGILFSLLDVGGSLLLLLEERVHLAVLVESVEIPWQLGEMWQAVHSLQPSMVMGGDPHPHKVLLQRRRILGCRFLFKRRKKTNSAPMKVAMGNGGFIPMP